jgi:hypothetical protein
MDEIAHDQLGVGEALRVTQRQGRVGHRAVDREPDIDDADAGPGP